MANLSLLQNFHTAQYIFRQFCILLNVVTVSYADCLLLYTILTLHYFVRRRWDKDRRYFINYLDFVYYGKISQNDNFLNVFNRMRLGVWVRTLNLNYYCTTAPRDCGRLPVLCVIRRWNLWLTTTLTLILTLNDPQDACPDPLDAFETFCAWLLCLLYGTTSVSELGPLVNTL